ncbi:NAD(P)-binding domain-containing protein [Niallia sp. Krafla_26]|uniref:NAD(P)-binding domain-containing protein n=1 Tax=Niallia sp. Krafla_26 TaxID=3064703 RepID=UPI003D18760A
MKVALVGIGRLGTALMKHWCLNDIRIGISHPDRTKAEQFVKKYSNGYVLTKKELSEMDYIILALSAKDIAPFLTEFGTSPKSEFINMATALLTSDLKEQFPDLTITGIKYMGHSKDLLDNGNGLFITESPIPSGVADLFNYQGKIVVDSEETLNEVNKIATYYSIKAAMKIESIMEEKGLSSDYVGRALTSIAPQVIKSYYEGNLGHFAKRIVTEIQNK